MSTTLADYLALHDGSQLLKTRGGTRSLFLRFQLPKDFISDQADRKPVLTYRARVPGKDTRLNVYVNPEQTESTSSGFPVTSDLSLNLSEGYFGQFVSVVSGSRFKKGQENKIVFTISGDGTKFGDIEVGEVALFYQRLIEGLKPG